MPLAYSWGIQVEYTELSTLPGTDSAEDSDETDVGTDMETLMTRNGGRGTGADSPPPSYLSWMPLAYRWGVQVEYTDLSTPLGRRGGSSSSPRAGPTASQYAQSHYADGSGMGASFSQYEQPFSASSPGAGVGGGGGGTLTGYISGSDYGRQMHSEQQRGVRLRQRDQVCASRHLPHSACRHSLRPAACPQ